MLYTTDCLLPSALFVPDQTIAPEAHLQPEQVQI